MKYIRELSGMPTIPHHAVLVNETIHRDSGWGSAPEVIVQYIAFDNERELLDWVKINHTKKTFRILDVTLVDYDVNISINLKEM